MASDWSIFNTDVKFIVGSNEYTIPIWNMRFSAGPYSRESGEGTHIRSFDGRYYTRHQGWRSRAVINWPEMTASSQQTLHDFIVDLVSVGVCTIVLDPQYGVQTVDMVIEDAATAIMAQFIINARHRPANLTLVSQNISDVAPTWITDPPQIIQPFTTVYALCRNTSTQASEVVIGARDEENFPWSFPSPIISIAYAAGQYTASYMRVDEGAELIFIIVYDSVLQRTTIRAYPLSGGAIYDELYYTDYGVDGLMSGIDINRINGEIYTTVSGLVTGGGYTARVDRVTYGGSVDTLASETAVAGTSLNGPAWDRISEIYYWYHPPFENRFKRVNRNSDKEEITTSLTEFNNEKKAVAYGTTGLYAARNIGSSDFYDIPLPDAGSKNTIDGLTYSGVAADWVDGYYYFSDGPSSIDRTPIGGGAYTNITSLANKDVHDLCLGF